MPSVSVVIPNYNHARFLPRRIESVLRQSYQDFELILLDDCSTDDSRAILSRYADDPRVRIEFNEKNSGSTFKQWNKGVRLARGKYVWIAESDDYADERLLETLVRRLDSDAATVFCYCRSWRVSDAGELDGFLDEYLSDLDRTRWTVDFTASGPEECRSYMIFRNTVMNASAVVFCKSVYEAIGGADESLILCGDWKVWASMALTSGKIAHVGEALNYYRFHDSSMREQTERLGVAPAEKLHVIAWLLRRARPDRLTRRKLCDELLSMWKPAVLNNRIPVRRRWSILKAAASIDPRALLMMIRPGFTALRLTVQRRCRAVAARFRPGSDPMENR